MSNINDDDGNVLVVNFVCHECDDQQHLCPASGYDAEL